MKKNFSQTPITHRGLHDNKSVPENSTLAFKNAIKKGYGIELDLYLTKDNNIVVHHDGTLKRTCGLNIKTINIDSNNLKNYKLINTDEYIPLFSDVLKLVDGKVFLVIEIKATFRVNKTCEAVWNILKDYKGSFCVESFQNSIVKWWKKNHPEILRGQLYNPNPLILTFNKLARSYSYCDFLAICIKSLPSKYFSRIKKNNPNLEFITWTVRSEKDLEIAKNCCDNYIFECNIKNTANIAPPPVSNKNS